MIEPKDSPTLTKATELCRDSLGLPTAVELDRGLDGFLAGIGPTKTRSRGFLRWSLAGITVALCILGTVQLASVIKKRWAGREVPDLVYRVEGGTVLEGGYLRPAGHAGMNLHFNEGSSLALSAGARSRLEAVEADCVHLAIERGTGSFHVTHKPNRRWLVDVGPFLVTVTGTIFETSWDPVREEFDLRLRAGSVVVRGPVAPGEIVLRAGQRLVANLAKVQTVITEETPGQPNNESPSAPPAPAANAPEPQTPSPSAPLPSVAPRAADHQWSRRLARGEWDRILQDARRMGIEATLNEASSEDLFALANAARYRHQSDLARSALLAERRRFPTSTRALEATYLLGRVEETQETGASKAIAWYDDYLTRAPTGPLAGEALGRKMTLTDKLAGPAKARALAEEYLRRFPTGNYAGSARELLAP
jgi:TolA-binding protein